MSHHLTAPGRHALTMPERLALEQNDEDNAARILSAHGDDLVFVTGRGWAIWDGTRYSLLAGDLPAREIGHKLRGLVSDEAAWARWNYEPPEWQVTGLIGKAVGKKPFVELIQTPEQSVDYIRRMVVRELEKHAIRCGNVAVVKSALTACEHQRRADVEDMDRNPWLLTLPNGMLDLRAAYDWERPEGCVDEEELAARAAWLVPVDRGILPTKCAGVEYDPAATCPGWLRFLDLVMPDVTVRDCLQRALGACLFGENRAQVCLILRGPGGNGKSTLLNALTHVLGSRDGYAQSCKIEMFLETGVASPGAATPEEVNLPGARVYIATEPGARDVLSAKKIKGLTGGDRRQSRGLYGGAFFWTPRGVPILSVNRTPKIKDEDEGTRRRLVFIPFDVNLRTLPEDQRRPPDEVDAELRAEGAGILNWLVDGFRAFMAQGINPPEPMQKLKTALLEAADPVGVFLDEMTVPDPAGSINVTEFYKVHERWAEAEGRTLYQMKTVGDILVEKGFTRRKSNGRSVWVGLGWSPEAAALVSDVRGQPFPTAPRPDPEPPF